MPTDDTRPDPLREALFHRIVNARHASNVDAAYECRSGVDRCPACTDDHEALRALAASPATDRERPEIECLCGDICESVEAMHEHIHLSHPEADLAAEPGAGEGLAARLHAERIGCEDHRGDGPDVARETHREQAARLIGADHAD